MFGHFRFSHMSGILWECGTAERSEASTALVSRMRVRAKKIWQPALPKPERCLLRFRSTASHSRSGTRRAVKLKRRGDAVRQAKLIQAMQVGILHGKVEPDHAERNPARQEVTNVVKPGERRQQAVIRKGEGEMVPKCTGDECPDFHAG